MDKSHTKHDVLLSETHDTVRIIRLNRPDKLNALNTELTQAFIDELIAADAENKIRAVVLSGLGRAFCAGADLSEFKNLTPKEHDSVLRRADLTLRAQSMLRHLSKPVVAAVHGVAMGGGAGLAIGADMLVTADSGVQFGYPELTHSIVPALVMSSIVRNFGAKTAFELTSLGRLLDGHELVTFGAANRVVPENEIEREALTIAQRWSEKDHRAMASMKDLFYRVSELPYDSAMRAGKDVNTIMRSFQGYENETT